MPVTVEERQRGLGARTTTNAMPLLLGMPLFFALMYALMAWGHRHGAVLGSPVLVAALGTLFGASGDERWQRLLGGGHLHTRPVLRLVYAMTLMATTLLLAGWGFLLPACAMLIAVIHIGWTGSRTWRPAAFITAIVTVISETIIHVGVVESVVSPAYSHVAAALNLTIAVFGLSNLGLSAARGEQAAMAVQRAEERYRALVRNSSDVVSVIDADGRLTHISDAVLQVSGRNAADLLNTSYLDLFHPDDQPEARAALAGLTSTGADSRARLEVRTRHHDGTWRWHEVTLHNAFGDPAVQGIVSNQRDVSDRRAHQDRLAYAASHDALTGLPNRAELLRLLAEASPKATAAEAVAVLFIDLDGFKAVNDTYGHATGDALLVAAAQRLGAGLRASDVLARLGGDEFAAFLTGVTNTASVHERAHRLMQDMAMPFHLAEHEVRIGASIGVALGHGPTDADALLARADAQMYTVKRDAAGRRRSPAVAAAA
ncbi:diguanylate cyclase [Actinoplanes sp. NEAU-A12]|uniref:Diguanylate cyclase n=1 Tax=Actinoplanes sandaracinus TaxID=3045177 RepID=A0ABT6WXT7_9ACTN|nr:sensor domain-containing diguanylate cyclase [Actinoplanes sandaracinus]MDI6104560.1 diguanylate cyclase [Actinoplanes sandaracinus]